MQTRAAAPCAGEPGSTLAAKENHAAGGTAAPLEGADDWDTLLNAVQMRLREALSEWPDSAPAPLGADDASALARAASFDCADALDQLHSTLVAEAKRCRQLALEINEARTKLRDACTELLGTQAEERQARHARLDQLLDAAAVPAPPLALLYLDLGKMADTAMCRAKRQQIGHAFFDEPGALRAVMSGRDEQRSG